MVTFSATIVLTLTSMAQMTPQEAVSRMIRGINMGNTLEPPYEDAWNNPPAEEVYFDLYKEAGFDVVRVPVRWDNHTDTEAPFQVAESWMDRVEEVVDWGLSRDLFIVINAHHEEWIKEDYANPVKRARFDSIWSQIAVRFRDKSEKLIFEIINEPYGLTKAQNDELHQRVLTIIRRTNPTRNVIIQGHNWGGSEDLIAMAIPDDPFLIGSFHSYDPWPFGLEGTGSFGNAVQLQELDLKFAAVKAWSVQHNIPVFLGEFGCNRTAEYNSRMRHYRAYVNLSQKYGFTSCAWDDGGSFRIMERSLRSWDEVKDILIHSSPGSPTISRMTIVQDTLVRISWNSGSGGQDSLIIEQRAMTSAFESIATVHADSTSCLHHNKDQGQYSYYRVLAHYPDGSMGYSNPLRIFVPSYVPKIRDYFLGAPIPVPGIVEAEDFDIGGEGLSYHDMDGQNIAGAYRPDEAVDIYDINSTGYHVGNALPGEWMEYSLQVLQEGDYQVDVHYATTKPGGSFQLQIGQVRSDTFQVSSTGSWVATKKLTFGMTLTAGEQIMRFNIVAMPLFNIDKIEFSQVQTSAPSSNQIPEPLIYQDGQGELLIESPPGNHVYRVEVYRISGVLTLTRAQPGQVFRISTEGMEPGIYLIRVMGESGVTRKKIMIRQ